MAARHGCWNLGGARKSAHRRTGLQGVSEPNQDEETAQEDHPVCSIQVGEGKRLCMTRPNTGSWGLSRVKRTSVWKGGFSMN